MKQQHKTLIVWLFFILIVVTIWVAFARPGEKVDERPFAQLIGQLEQGAVKDVKIQETSKGWVFTGEYKEDTTRFVSLGLMNDVVQSSL